MAFIRLQDTLVNTDLITTIDTSKTPLGIKFGFLYADEPLIIEYSDEDKLAAGQQEIKSELKRLGLLTGLIPDKG